MDKLANIQIIISGQNINKKIKMKPMIGLMANIVITKQAPLELIEALIEKKVIQEL